ncbi:MAG TPA: DUF192 domain-containing protein [Vicinamibacterales bacterium]|nr:DUF192 domain-containing protein [Vicinamibacterales bacterium]
MKGLPALLLFAGIAVAATDAVAHPPPELFPGLPRSELQIVTGSGSHYFQVWIAADDRSRARGLMNVRALPANHGMLFLFERPQYAAFWMKDTYLSLDLIFIDADGVVVNVAANATPLSLEPISSAAPVKAVLELAGSTTARIGLVAGDRIMHPALAARSEGIDHSTE